MNLLVPGSDQTELAPPLDSGERGLAARLRRHVDVLAGLIGPRHIGRPSSMEAAVAHIRRELESVGHACQLESYDCGGQTAVNVIAEVHGATRPDEIVILGAHYDTISETPGADDNASAVAGLLETARILSGRQFKRTVRFVAFANEEPPHFHTGEMGSQIHAYGCRKRNEKIVGMICLEMIGYFDTAEGSQRYPELLPRPLVAMLPKRGTFIAMVSNLKSAKLLFAARRGFKKAVKFPLAALPLPERIFEIHLSDHSSFWYQNYPALMVTDTSFFRNPHYHLPSDVPETLDYERLARVTRGVAGAVERVAGRVKS